MVTAFLPSSVFAKESKKKGLDVSEWQGDINYAEVKKAGIDIVYIRCAEGSDYIDMKFETNYRRAKDAGLKIGFYHYVTATTITEAKQQASFFYSLIKDKEFECYPAMDYEYFSGLDKTEINKIAKVYLDTLKDLLGYDPIIYTDANNAKNTWSSSLVKYKLWIADYDVKTPQSIGHWQD